MLSHSDLRKTLKVVELPAVTVRFSSLNQLLLLLCARMLNSEICYIHIILRSIFWILWFDREAEILALLLQMLQIPFHKQHNNYNYDNIVSACIG